ncbi:MAG: hypothetical protein IIA14_01425, partial [SAR324 cluster bacterium]|nr:hypothetical protein [SAR324 cluster bacterium]
GGERAILQTPKQNGKKKMQRPEITGQAISPVDKSERIFGNGGARPCATEIGEAKSPESENEEFLV